MRQLSTDRRRYLGQILSYGVRGVSHAVLVAVGSRLVTESDQTTWYPWMSLLTVVVTVEAALQAALTTVLAERLAEPDDEGYTLVLLTRYRHKLRIVAVAAVPLCVGVLELFAAIASRTLPLRDATLLSLPLALSLSSCASIAWAQATQRPQMAHVGFAAGRLGALGMLALTDLSIAARLFLAGSLIACMPFAFCVISTRRHPHSPTQDGLRWDVQLRADTARTSRSARAYLGWSITSLLAGGFDLPLVNRFDASRAPTYATGVAIGGLLTGTIAAIVAPLTPRIAALRRTTPADIPALAFMWVRRTVAMCIAFATVACAAALAASMWPGWPSAGLVVTVALGTASRSVWSGYTAVIRGTDEAVQLRALPYGEGVVNLAATAVLASVVGAYGPCLATLGVASVMAVVVSVVGDRRMPAATGHTAPALRRSFLAGYLGIASALTVVAVLPGFAGLAVLPIALTASVWVLASIPLRRTRPAPVTR